MWIGMGCAAAVVGGFASGVVVVDRDDVVIGRSCRVVVVDEPIADAGGDGVVQVTGSGITVDFAGAHLRGATGSDPAEAFAGVGVRVTGSDVTVRGARVSGFRVAILAEGADRLVVEDCDVSGNFAQRLASTPWAEDASDWLWPHADDGGEWLGNYGAGIAIRDADRPVVRGCRARDGQNGLVLERVTRGRVFDNDFSFLSGWGIALWRSSENAITRNAVDFCVRGYSHGAYNRGQDSAGILMFEQCSRNLVAENSATHSGDGVFVFAGREALGEVEAPEPGFEHARRGCNDNWFVANDLSDAAAHGIEVTFSAGNRVLANRVAGNAICGLWGGYSRDTLVAGNRFEANGEAGYALERGGVNIEHGRQNRIHANAFRANRCGVHLWWDEDPAIAETPWARANGVACADNAVTANRFSGDGLAVHLRAAERTVVADNRFEDVGEELRVEGEAPERTGSTGWRLPADAARVLDAIEHDPEGYPTPLAAGSRVGGLPVLGVTRPVGARRELAGREHIVVTDRGPYTWDEPLLRLASRGPDGHRWQVLGVASTELAIVEGAVHVSRVAGDGASAARVAPDPLGARTWAVRPETASGPGRLAPYAFELATPEGRLRGSGTILTAVWDVRAFAWEVDPREDETAWRRAAASVPARFEIRGPLDLRFGSGGPAAFAEEPGIPRDRPAELPPDRFGTIAETEVVVPSGRLRVDTLSDDGIRVRVDGVLVVDDWTWHAPRRHAAEVDVDPERPVRIRVEHFELDGHAVLVVELE